MIARVEHSPFDKGSIYGYVLVLDTYRSRADGGVRIDVDDNCFVSYFNREWYEPEHINNDFPIPFGDPSSLHSIPFGSSIEVEVKLQATSDDKDQTYLLTNCKGTPPVSDFWLGDSDLEYGTIKYEGIDGRVYLNYGPIRDALDTKFELKLTNVTSAPKVSGDIVAYYGDAALGDRGLIGHYYALIFRANPTEYIGLEEDLPLLKSTLAVPVNGRLKIKARLTDVNYGLIRDALDTKFELKLTKVTSAAKVCGDIVAYYGDAALGDRGLLGHYYALIFRANPTQYIGLEEDLPLHKSTLAVPVNGRLKIKARLTDVKFW